MVKYIIFYTKTRKNNTTINLGSEFILFYFTLFFHGYCHSVKAETTTRAGLPHIYILNTAKPNFVVFLPYKYEIYYNNIKHNKI